jgi:hypothetical protein
VTALPYGVIDHPALGRVRYTLQEVSEDPDSQVESTISLMRQYANEDASQPLIQVDAGKAWKSEDPLRDTWEYLARHANGDMAFVSDEATAEPLGSWRPVVETLIRPVDQVVLRQRQGDCDDFSMLGAAHLLARGVPCAYVTVAADAQDPLVYSHVYLAAYPSDSRGYGHRVAMDLSHGPELGWEVSNKYNKRREWPLDGSDVLLKWAMILGGGILAWKLCRGAN